MAARAAFLPCQPSVYRPPNKSPYIVQASNSGNDLRFQWRYDPIGPWPPVEGLWIAAGHEGLGISMAPMTGMLLAQQITGADTAVDPTPYLPARFVP
jgi:glycine/D-amino acid oxidase-like deaminating enzyme